MRKKVVAGNWKMNTDIHQTTVLINELKQSLGSGTEGVDVVVCPPFPSLVVANSLLKDTKIALGAQNMSQHSEGAYTGEVSGKMLISAGCTFVILGHSERRQFYSENDILVNAKIKTALKENLTPIVCVGETLTQREAGDTHTVITEQINGALDNISAEEAGKIIIAYEPVWAIGTGKNATPDQANEVHRLIRGLVSGNYSKTLAGGLTIIYGGSVNAQNASFLFSQSEIDGGLIGGASLKSDIFSAIISAASASVRL